MKHSVIKILVVSLMLIVHVDAKADDYRKGIKAYDNKDYSTAAKYLKKAAEKGNADAEYYLGLLYFTGRGVDKDGMLAIDYWDKAAKLHQPQALAAQGTFYLNTGSKENPNLSKAFYYFQQAAKYGDKGSKNLINFMTIMTQGSSRNLHHAQQLAQLNKPDVVPVYRVPGEKISAQALRNGKAVYDKYCAMCHAKGLMGAPRVGVKADWSGRLKQGLNAVYHNAIYGTGKMSAKGGFTSLKNQEVVNAVDYLLSDMQ